MSRGDYAFVLGLVVVAIAIPATIATLHFAGWGGSPGRVRWIIGGIFAILAALIALHNFYLSLVRPWLFARRHGNTEDLQHVSPVPAIGSILVVIAAVSLPSNPVLGGLLLLCYLIDTGGIHVAAIAFTMDIFNDDSAGK